MEMLDSNASSSWGSLRAAMGHPQPFELKYVAIGNEDCERPKYKANYLKFYAALASAYPDIKVISNCEPIHGRLDHPADFYDFHRYASASELFSMTHVFDKGPRDGPKAFVSEYVVNSDDAGNGNLLAALAEAAFLLGAEKNRSLPLLMPPVNTSISSSQPGVAPNWYPTTSEMMKPNGLHPYIPTTRSVNPNDLTSNHQLYQQQAHYHQQHQFVPSTSAVDLQAANRAQALSKRVGSSPTLPVASSLGLFSGLGSVCSSGRHLQLIGTQVAQCHLVTTTT